MVALAEGPEETGLDCSAVLSPAAVARGDEAAGTAMESDPLKAGEPLWAFESPKPAERGRIDVSPKTSDALGAPDGR
jgi:hypothetical protein